MNKYLESIAAISPDKQQSSPDESVGLKNQTIKSIWALPEIASYFLNN
ncbi:hypothetical protein HCG51_06740 [Tolypothrix sp. PCC 7910]|nr:hypothetical protein [Tolypothrix sp. PCC 7910]QIR36478.1 hypothetical protein HCG51_06740 [Tolypothrix sp. PCC 7910]